MNAKKKNNMFTAYKGFKGQQTLNHIRNIIGAELAEELTGKQLGMVMNAVNKAYQEGKSSAGAEMIDSNCVYIDKLGQSIEWTNLDGELIPRFNK